MLFFKTNTMCVFILVYMDDIVITRSSQRGVQILISKLASHFKFKDISNLKYFIGMELNEVDKSGWYVLSQQRYILDLLRNTNIENAKSTIELVVSSTKLSAMDGVSLQDKLIYRSTVVALQYLVHTIPKRTLPVNNKLCQFLQNPTTTHCLQQSEYWGILKVQLVLVNFYH